MYAEIDSDATGCSSSAGSQDRLNQHFCRVNPQCTRFLEWFGTGHARRYLGGMFFFSTSRYFTSVSTRRQMGGRSSSLSTHCKRFASILRRCYADSFLNIGRLCLEIAPMEKRIDMHIGLLRREEFRGVECVSDVAKSAVPFIRGEDLNYNPIGPARNFTTSARPLPGSTSVLERGNWGTRHRLITTSTCSLRRPGWSRLPSRLR